MRFYYDNQRILLAEWRTLAAALRGQAEVHSALRVMNLAEWRTLAATLRGQESAIPPYVG